MVRDVLKVVIPSILLLLVGCRSAPLYNVDSTPVVANKAVTLADVEKAIMRAGAGLGWQIVARAPGQIEGTLLLRTHRAVVDIAYNTKTYSIKYKDSSNLDYDGTNIHSNYNGWIQNLDNAIRSQLSLL
jgi:hypothetical protein